MGIIYQQILDLITTNPGNLIYHVVLAFTIMGATQAALSLWRDEAFPQGRRMVTGFGLLLGLRLLLFLVGILGLVGAVDPHVLLPNADRAIIAFNLIIILWLWIFPEPLRLADAASGVLGILILSFFLLIQVWWGSNNIDTTFNATFANVVWEILSLSLLVLGFVLLLLRRPNSWGYGLGMLIILAAGHLVHFIFPDVNSDYPGAVRLFEMAAFPLLWSIPHRFNIPKPRTETAIQTKTETIDASPDTISPKEVTHRRFTVDPKMFRDVLMLADRTTRETMQQKLTKLLGETMLADICLLISPPDDQGQMLIQCAYDLIRETFLPSLYVDSRQLPMLVSAMKRGRPLRLPASSTSPDINNLTRVLNLGHAGHILAAFVPSAEGKYPQLGILLISPYADHRWSRDDQAFLNIIAATMAPILQQTYHLEKVQNELQFTKHNLQSFQDLLKETQSENKGLKSELKELSRQAIKVQEGDTPELLESLHESQDLIKQLRSEKQHLETRINALSTEASLPAEDRERHKEELKLALNEIAILHNQLAEADQQVHQLKSVAGFAGDSPSEVSDDQIKVLTSIVQDLRQPMSSILGYTELLLSESAGIIGALQRKLLERINASIERMEILLDDLFQVVTLDTSDLNLHPEEVDLANVIDAAIVETRRQFQERGIALRLDLPHEMPRLIADQDALQQIVIHLLNNAGTATPINGEIFLRASIYQSDNSEDYTLIQVADQGGGIPKDDLPRVFSRLYRADNPEIKGIGETGVGLSIVKALVEAHDGRIWVDSEMGRGSTFSLLIPLSPQKDITHQAPPGNGSTATGGSK